MIATWPIQVALYAALTEAPATYRVYDAVPQGAPFPYIVIGEFTGAPDLELAAPSVDLTVQLYAWSRYAGKAEVQAMCDFVRARLDGAEDIAGVWACTEDFLEVLEDQASTEAARIYRGIMRYRLRAD